MPPVVIERAASEADVDGVLEVEQASFSNPWTREMYLNELANERVSFIYTARDPAGRVIGFCSFWRILDELHVNNLAVAPDHRGAGVGSALLDRILKEGARLGATRATLEVRRSNGAALRLYARFGFVEAGVRRGYYTHPVEDALVLWREQIGTA